MARTSLGTDLKILKLTSATAADVSGYGVVTIVCDVTTANGGISAFVSGGSSSQTDTKHLKSNTGADITTLTSASTGPLIAHYIGGNSHIKATFANANVYAILSEPIRQA